MSARSPFNPETLELARRLGTATLHEASGLPVSAVDPALRPVWAGASVAGPAFPVECAPGDNLAIHLALEQAPRGSLLVVTASGFIAGYWGEVLTVAAEAAGIAGLVIDGGVRDTAALAARHFPVFARGISVRGTRKVCAPSVGQPISLMGTPVAAGDLVVADDDGVVVIPATQAERTLAAGKARADKEEAIMQQLRQGRSILDLPGLSQGGGPSMTTTMATGFSQSRIPIKIDGVELEVAAISRSGETDPIVFLHGFGSTKEDYADMVRHPAFAGRPFLAYDAPGCGETACSDLSKISIPFLVETALAVLEQHGIERFHLSGHSMGGLTALMLAHQHPGRVLSFIDIEGNIAPEDCFLSRQILDYPSADAERFFTNFIERTRHAPAHSSALYAASLRHKVRAEAVPGIFRSMVELSDRGGLMDKFLGLPCPRMFMYGEQNASLSYLGHIQAKGVRLAEIPDCAHFPMYSNPPLMWKAIAEFLDSLGDGIQTGAPP